MSNESRKAEEIFPTQSQFTPKPFLNEDLQIGAPHGPLPKSFYRVPQRLNASQPVATPDEIETTLNIRKKFNIGSYQAPYVADIIRAFRLISGAKTYLEIGTFDRGNLAYLATILSDDAIIIGVDVIEEKTQDNLLREHLKPGQTYYPIVGSSRSDETIRKVASILGENKLDGIFIDGDHTAFGVMSDYARYEDFVSNTGIFLFHDSVWEGDVDYKGSADALSEIDRLDPVYLIDGENPIRRFLRPQWRNPLWGVVGVVFADTQSWRENQRTSIA